jgi:hypothetical protein
VGVRSGYGGERGELLQGQVQARGVPRAGGRREAEVHLQGGKNHFFAFDGFLMYCQQCRDSDFGQRVIDSIELTNYQWQT